MTQPFNRHERRQEEKRTGVMPPPPAPMGTPVLGKQYFMPQGGFPFVTLVRRVQRDGEDGPTGSIECDGMVGPNGQTIAKLTPDMFLDAEAFADLIALRTVELQRQDETYLHLGLLLEALGELSCRQGAASLTLLDGVITITRQGQDSQSVGIPGLMPQVADWREAFQLLAAVTAPAPVAEEVAPA